MIDAGVDGVTVGNATDALLRARSGEHLDIAAKYVRVIRPGDDKPEGAA
jgi:hypothetical protein